MRHLRHLIGDLRVGPVVLLDLLLWFASHDGEHTNQNLTMCQAYKDLPKLALARPSALGVIDPMTNPFFNASPK